MGHVPALVRLLGSTHDGELAGDDKSGAEPYW